MTEVSTRLYWSFQSLIAFTPYLLAGLLAGALVLSISVFLARFLLWDWLLPFEESCLLTLKGWSNPTLDRSMIAVTWLAQGEITIPLLFAVGGILLYRNEAIAALVLAIGLSGSLLAANLTHCLSVPISITATLAAILTLGVGFSRVYLGMHWPTDVLSGWMAGGIWLGACLHGLIQIGGI